MPPKEPSNAQLSSRLSYQARTPSFLQKFQNRVAGRPDSEDEEDEDFEYDGSGRPPVPKRPPIPERPKDEPGSADEGEDPDDERPQVVVVKEGKHLTGLEVENERRKAKGLPPLPSASDLLKEQEQEKTAVLETDAPDQKHDKPGLSFSSGKSSSKSAMKRKAISDLRDERKSEGKIGDKATKKKPKKAQKKLLSFGDGDDA